MTGTIVTPVVGETPEKSPQGEGAEENAPAKKEGFKWESSDGSKWMKKK